MTKINNFSNDDLKKKRMKAIQDKNKSFFFAKLTVSILRLFLNDKIFMYSNNSK